MTAPKAAAPAMSKEGVFRFLKDFREGYDATSFGIYYQAFSLMQDARHMEEVGHVAELRFHRDPTNRIDGMELVRLSPKAPALQLESGRPTSPDDEIVQWSDGNGATTFVRYGDLMMQDRKTVERGEDGVLRGGYDF